ncbi:FecR family protein [Desulfovibrio inopinatus]|uniref:FecR family protein n=1 Tax=Desulfovibrio inopinatus TaxID=102109 RepID=UPI0006851D5B|nr:FecR domain-containing protein [Desulfovibrio inopinatus]
MEGKIMRIFITSIVLLAALATSALAQDHVATMKDVAGDVDVERKGTTFVPVVGDKLQKGDIIRTKSDGSVGFTFIDGTRIGMGESSEMTVAQYTFNPLEKQYAFDVFLKKGSAVYSSGKLGKLDPKSVSFRTPKATVGVRGTKFVVKVQ